MASTIPRGNVLNAFVVQIAFDVRKVALVAEIECACIRQNQFFTQIIAAQVWKKCRERTVFKHG